MRTPEQENVLNASYEVIKLFGKKVLFTSERIRDSDLPKGIYKYEVRHDDECQGIMCEIAKRIFVNHWGTILSKEEIDLGTDGYRIIDEDKDVIWMSNENISLKKFTHTNLLINSLSR